MEDGTDPATVVATADGEAGASAPTQAPSDPARWDAFRAWGERGRRGPLVALALVVVAVALSFVPYLFDERFYFNDDTQTGAYGIWYVIGQSLRAGEIPFFEPSRWMAGNYAAEGQWGLFNPLMMLVGLGASAAQDMTAYAALVKVAFLAIAAGGWFLVLRSYGADRTWGFLGAVLTTCTGFTVYVDAASWVTGLFVWALLPWAWWGLRRVAGREGSPLWAFLGGYLVITVGYVHGTIMLIAVILATLVEALVARRRAGAVRVLAVGALLGLVALASYLPGLLTAPVTVRDATGILNDNFMSPDLSGLSTSWIATAQPWVSGFWGLPAPGPILYIAWLLPAVLFVRLDRARSVLPTLLGLLLVGAFAAVFVLGPSAVGPLRFPARLMPYLATCVIGVVVVLLARAAGRPSTRRIVTVSVVVLVGAYFAYAEAPSWWKVYAASTVLALAGVVALGMLLRRGGPRQTRAVLAGGLAVTTLVVVLQHATIPQAPLPDYGLSGQRADYQDKLPEAEGDVMVVGTPQFVPGAWSDVAYANLWYLNDASVQNVYTPLQYRTYSEDLCMSSHGATCWDVVDTLFATDETTGRPVADLLSVSTLQIVRRSDGESPDPYADAEPPPGWHEAGRTPLSVAWVRDEPVDPAGGIAWTSEGTEVSDVTVTGTRVELTVDGVPEGGGQIVFSRLAWPGYTVEGASLADPVRDYLLTVDVPPTSAGERVTVSFLPPGWTVGLVSLGVAIGGALVWSILSLAVPRFRRASATRSART
ncbi:hypothetical protein [Cellulosimicrobium cellulans]|uniref:hypothetical protein n=1 Tax=Cellulosimicrobium cellulans TaxID=1710 RepID=UPI0012FE1B8F|nr:hypothetical protein [Cellulosimicrobium cellulans]